MTPEQKARERIDAMLALCGWEVQDYKKFNPSTSRSIALREVPLKTGPCDYLLLVDRHAAMVFGSNLKTLSMNSQISNFKSQTDLSRPAGPDKAHQLFGEQLLNLLDELNLTLVA